MLPQAISVPFCFLTPGVCKESSKRSFFQQKAVRGHDIFLNQYNLSGNFKLLLRLVQAQNVFCRCIPKLGNIISLHLPGTLSLSFDRLSSRSPQPDVSLWVYFNINFLCINEQLLSVLFRKSVNHIVIFFKTDCVSKTHRWSWRFSTLIQLQRVRKWSAK